ncbi:MAG: glycosyltransferase family 4 protein [Solirubrobacteraceae bacterium]
MADLTTGGGASRPAGRDVPPSPGADPSAAPPAPDGIAHVGLNLLYLVPGAVGGSEIYAHQLVDALARHRPDVRFTVFCGREAAPSLRGVGWPANVRVHTIPVDCANKPARIVAENTLLPGAAARAGVDLLHSLGTTAPLVAGRPSVVTILDLIYDAFPTTFPPAARIGLRVLVGPGARRATRVITISEAVKRDVVARLRVPAERVDPVLLGHGMRVPADPTAPDVLRARLGLGDGPVVLCVSAALVHKNLPRLIDAFAKLTPARPDPRLVIVGHHGRERDGLERQIAEQGLDGRVVLTGWIDDADLEGLYGLAACCAYPSLYEGFGLPVLEAMIRGVPIACSDATSLPEVAGDAALLFDPHDPVAIARAIATLLDDPARAALLRDRGRARAARFTWERCAAGVWETYRRVRTATSGRRAGS